MVYSDAQAGAYGRLVAHYHGFFADPAGDTGLRPAAITDPEDTRQLTAYFSWSAWVAAAERPGKSYSYTNNWPPEALVDNGPTADVLVWSVLSLIALLAGIGALLAVFGRWNWLGWHGRDQQELSFRSPDRVALTPSQKATAGFFLAMAALFLVQSLVGVASQHYRAEIGGFFGIDSDRPAGGLAPVRCARVPPLREWRRPHRRTPTDRSERPPPPPPHRTRGSAHPARRHLDHGLPAGQTRADTRAVAQATATSGVELGPEPVCAAAFGRAHIEPT